MASSRQHHRIATNVGAYIRFITTGALPECVRVRSPLITLLESIPPRERLQIRGLRVGPALGYTGSRQFHTAAQALSWCRPDSEVFTSWPAESWRDKRFNEKLYLEDLQAACASFPSHLAQRYPGLCRPRPRSIQPGSEGTV